MPRTLACVRISSASSNDQKSLTRGSGWILSRAARVNFRSVERGGRSEAELGGQAAELRRAALEKQVLEGGRVRRHAAGQGGGRVDESQRAQRGHASCAKAWRGLREEVGELPTVCPLCGTCGSLTPHR